MADKENTPFIGKTKRIYFKDGGHVDNLNIHVDQINEWINEEGWLNLQIFNQRDGKGIYVKPNTYKKNG